MTFSLSAPFSPKNLTFISTHAGSDRSQPRSRCYRGHCDVSCSAASPGLGGCDHSLILTEYTNGLFPHFLPPHRTLQPRLPLASRRAACRVPWLASYLPCLCRLLRKPFFKFKNINVIVYVFTLFPTHSHRPLAMSLASKLDLATSK